MKALYVAFNKYHWLSLTCFYTYFSDQTIAHISLLLYSWLYDVIYLLSLLNTRRCLKATAFCCLLIFSIINANFSFAVEGIKTDILPAKPAILGQPKVETPSLTIHTDTSDAKKSELQTSEFDYCDAQYWLDDWYCHFNYGVETSVIEINRWFITDYTPTSKRARASGKLRFGIEPRSGNLNQLDFRFKIRVKLPALQDRVELLLSDDEEDVNQQAVKAARSQQLGSDDQATVALQFKDKPDSKVAYRIGLGRGSQIYTRARYSDKLELNERNKISYSAEANYYTDDQLGVETRISLIHTLSKNEAIEFDNTFRYRDKTEDLFWRHEIQYLYLKDGKTSYLFSAMVDGLNKPNYQEEQVLVSMRYKKNVLRPWLFLEVEPYVIWLRQENFRTSFGVAIRAEVHFPDY